MKRAGLAFVCLLAMLAAGASSGATPRASSRAGSLILFWSDSPIPSLWSIRPDGSHRHRIRLRQNCKRPSLSPDRKWIVFDGTPPGKPPLTDFDVQAVRGDGTGRRILAGSDDRELDARWSSDGTRISFERWRWLEGDDWRDSWIWTMRPDGGDARPLVHGNSARWSPDGKRLVFSAPTAGSDGDLFVIDANGTGLHRLLATPRLEQPNAWSPDGKKILFTRFPNDRESDVYVMGADGTNVRRLTRAVRQDVGGTWSPDGSRIVFTSERLGRTHLFVMRANGTGQHAITARGANDFDPSWY
jgi:Tol biopolymer transport system component